MSSLFKSWVEAVRLRTLPVSVAGVITAVAFNISDGTFKLLPAVLCLVFAVLCQIVSNFANEYYDYKAGRDKVGREGPRRGVTEGDISPWAMKYATFAVLALAALVGLSLTYWGGLWLIVVGLFIGIFALAYSAGPWPLSTHCMGEVAVFFFFGIIPVNFTYYVQALSWSWPVLAASAAIGLMIANVLIVNNYRDADDDAAVGKHTLANTIGRKAMPYLYVVNVLIALLLMLPIWLSMAWPWIIVPSVYLVAAVFIAIRMTACKGRALNPFLGITAMSILLYSILFFIARI